MTENLFYIIFSEVLSYLLLERILRKSDENFLDQLNPLDTQF